MDDQQADSPSTEEQAEHHRPDLEMGVGSLSKNMGDLSEEMTARRSGRAIRRKKFDDEIVDTAPVFGAGSGYLSNLPQSPSSPVVPCGSSSHIPAPASPSTSSWAQLLSSPASSIPTCRSGQGKGKSGVTDTDSRMGTKKSSKVSKKKKSRKSSVWKDLGRWKPADDLALITAVLQTNDIATVHRGIKFSCHFKLSEVQSRWQALLYNPIISKLALQAIRNLPPEIVAMVQRKTLLSQQEKEILFSIKANKSPSPNVKDFEELLEANPGCFHAARTPEDLFHYWQSLKQYCLLPDQSVQPLPKDNHILNFLDAESSINDGELFEPRDEFLYHELALADRKAKREIRHLEAEIQKWQVLVDMVRGENPPDFDNQTLAVLRGRLVRYLMRSKEITLGRSTKDHPVDVDLKLEGQAWKISRRQGVIKLQNSGEFHISNEGKRCLFVDGKPIRRGCRVRLNNNSVLEIAGLKFVFLINQDLIEAIRQEATRIYQNS